MDTSRWHTTLLNFDTSVPLMEFLASCFLKRYFDVVEGKWRTGGSASPKICHLILVIIFFLFTQGRNSSSPIFIKCLGVIHILYVYVYIMYKIIFIIKEKYEQF